MKAQCHEGVMQDENENRQHGPTASCGVTQQLAQVTWFLLETAEGTSTSQELQSCFLVYSSLVLWFFPFSSRLLSTPFDVFVVVVDKPVRSDAKGR